MGLHVSRLLIQKVMRMRNLISEFVLDGKYADKNYNEFRSFAVL